MEPAEALRQTAAIVLTVMLAVRDEVSKVVSRPGEERDEQRYAEDDDNRADRECPARPIHLCHDPARTCSPVQDRTARYSSHTRYRTRTSRVTTVALVYTMLSIADDTYRTHGPSS